MRIPAIEATGLSGTAPPAASSPRLRKPVR
jgi:hypothetical protein